MLDVTNLYTYDVLPGLDLSRVWQGWPPVDGAQDFDHGFLFGE